MTSKIEDFWKPSFDTLYDACFYEFASEFIIRRWSHVHVVTAVLAAVTTSGSAISGWALWSRPEGKLVWASIAGLATFLSIIHGVLGVPSKIKEEEQRRQDFSALRVDLESFRHSLSLNCDIGEATKAFEQLRQRLSVCVSKTTPDIAFTTRARKCVQEKVNDKLRKYIQ
jgi:hypothetical protein